MTTLLAHTGHLLPHDRTVGFIGAALLLLGAATVLLSGPVVETVDAAGDGLTRRRG